MKKWSEWIFRGLKRIVWWCYSPYEILGKENLPDEPAIFVGNHAQIHGPIFGELYFPKPCMIWCSGEMMSVKTVPQYAYRDFWSAKPRGTRWFYRLLSYAIAPLSSLIFNHAHTIPVYHDQRAVTMFRTSVKTLQEGKSLLIFPECHCEYHPILCNFQDRFIDLAKLYHHREGKSLSFVPFYLAPTLKKAVFGKPIPYDPERGVEEERIRISDALKRSILDLAASLPEHVVVPYQNVPKKDYPLSSSAKETL